MGAGASRATRQDSAYGLSRDDPLPQRSDSAMERRPSTQAFHSKSLGPQQGRPGPRAPGGSSSRRGQALVDWAQYEQRQQPPSRRRSSVSPSPSKQGNAAQLAWRGEAPGAAAAGHRQPSDADEAWMAASASIQRRAAAAQHDAAAAAGSLPQPPRVGAGDGDFPAAPPPGMSRMQRRISEREVARKRAYAEESAAYLEESAAAAAASRRASASHQMLRISIKPEEARTLPEGSMGPLPVSPLAPMVSSPLVSRVAPLWQEPALQQQAPRPVSPESERRELERLRTVKAMASALKAASMQKRRAAQAAAVAQEAVAARGQSLTPWDMAGQPRAVNMQKRPPAAAPVAEAVAGGLPLTLWDVAVQPRAVMNMQKRTPAAAAVAAVAEAEAGGRSLAVWDVPRGPRARRTEDAAGQPRAEEAGERDHESTVGRVAFWLERAAAAAEEEELDALAL